MTHVLVLVALAIAIACGVKGPPVRSVDAPEAEPAAEQPEEGEE